MKDGPKATVWTKARRAVGIVMLAVLLFALVMLGRAHYQIDSLSPALPTPEQVAAGRDGSDRPTEVFFINTASQRAPRFSVLDADVDPHSDRPYVMGHHAFVLRWADGRMFVVDTGLTREHVTTFGEKIEVIGADPSTALGSVREHLGDAALKVAAIGLTHLHEDHTDGLAELCEGRTVPLPIMQGPNQLTLGNYTTQPGRDHIDAATCAKPQRVDPDPARPLRPVPGFSGLFMFEAAGHTPGSQVFVAHVGTDEARTWVFAGDIANHIDGIRQNLPKPGWYSWFLVPESERQLSAVRMLLRALEEQGSQIAITHDQGHLASTPMIAWSAE